MLFVTFSGVFCIKGYRIFFRILSSMYDITLRLGRLIIFFQPVEDHCKHYESFVVVG